MKKKKATRVFWIVVSLIVGISMVFLPVLFGF